MIVGLAVLGFAASPAAAQSDNANNKGTIKVHEGEDADPDRRNEPHVECGFFVEGFNMKEDSGYLVFYDWPPTGDKSEVTPAGDGLDWTGEAEEDNNGGFHFLNGEYDLPPGHYRVEAWEHGVQQDRMAKAKMFWVDECEGPKDDECPDVELVASAESDGDILLEWDVDGEFNIYRAEGDGDLEYLTTVDGTSYTDTDTTVGETYTYTLHAFDGERETEECARAQATAVPFFPNLAVGALALIGSVGLYASLRRK